MMILPKTILHPLHCRYFGHRYPPWEERHIPYELTEAFWFILAARLAFMMIFIGTVVILVNLIECIFKHPEIYLYAFRS